jgi:rhamnose utilization protein RhaD (predicted bifunctional aldolase and dehydrogenase)
MLPVDLLHAYAKLSWGAGKDISFVQGGGGNVSIKHDGRLLIKASGSSLRAELNKLDFVDLDIQNAKDFYSNSNSYTDFEKLGLGTKRPSIETPLHLECNGIAVAHVHSLGAVCLGLVHSFEDNNKSEVFDVKIVPYIEPGKDLVDFLSNLGFINEECGEVVLGNHGLLVWDTSVEKCLRRLNNVENNLRARLAKNKTGIRNEIQKATQSVLDTGYIPLHHTSQRWMRFIQSTFLLPDQVVYLDGVDICHRISNKGIDTQKLNLNQRDMLLFLNLIGIFISPDDCRNTITEQQVAVLRGLDSEKFRRKIEN